MSSSSASASSTKASSPSRAMMEPSVMGSMSVHPEVRRSWQIDADHFCPVSQEGYVLSNSDALRALRQIGFDPTAHELERQHLADNMPVKSNDVQPVARFNHGADLARCQTLQRRFEFRCRHA